MFGNKKAKIVEQTMLLENIEPEVCEKHFNGLPTSEGECLVKLEIDEDKQEVSLLKLDRRT